MNLPNKLTLMRMILVPVVVVFFYLGALAPIFYYLATAMFIIAAITDFFDGYLARKHNLITDFGKFMDPLADKALVLVALILIVDKGLVAELIPVPYTLFTALNLIAPISLIIMLIRELVVSGVRLVGANKGVVIAADKLGKIKTFTQDIAGNCNPVTGDFSFGIEGFAFSRGKLTHPVREMLITGNMMTLWNSIIAAGNDARECTRWQVPSLAFENVSFSS